jgi:lipoprotein signal peptidase
MNAPASAPTIRRARLPFLLTVSATVAVLDLATKAWAQARLETPEGFPRSVDVIPGWFDFSLARNRGGAWSFLHDAPERVRMAFFPTVSVLAIIVIVVAYRRLRHDQWLAKIALPLVLGGAVGNLVDRLRYGFVIDFLHAYGTFGGATHHFPTFNVADVGITVGSILLALESIFVPDPGPPPND